MKIRKEWVCALILALVPAAVARGQAGAPAAPAPATGLVALCQYIDQKIQACKAKICACPLGQMISNMTTIMNTYGGGLICPPCCPPVNPDDLKKPADSAAGACARFRKDLEEMPARRAAVRCLAYADCRWWPEAEAALVNSLRTDRMECVRWEAAKVLGSGCCCTKKTMEALTIVVSGSNRDGNPAENSPRVKAAAMASLQHCVDHYREQLPEPEKPEKAPVPRPVAAAGVIQPAGALVPQANPMAATIENARRALAEVPKDIQLASMQPGNQSLYGAIVTAAVPVPPVAHELTESVAARPPASAPVAAASPEPPSPEPHMLPAAGNRGLFQICAHAFHRQPPEDVRLAPTDLEAVAADWAKDPRLSVVRIDPRAGQIVVRVKPTGGTLFFVVTKIEPRTLLDGQEILQWEFEWRDESGRVLSLGRDSGAQVSAAHVAVPGL